MPKETPQSLEAQLKMARPKRSEVKRVPLTSEEKEFLGEIMEKAVAAEKAGKLQEALDYYIDYKNELLKIKENKEKEEKEEDVEIEWTEEKLVKWVGKVLGGLPIVWRQRTEEMFDLSELPNLITNESLTLNDEVIDEFPTMWVNGNLLLARSAIKKWLGKGLNVNGELNLVNSKISYLPENTYAQRLLLQGSKIKDLPESLLVKGDIHLRGCSEKVIEKARILKKGGNIGGNVII